MLDGQPNTVVKITTKKWCNSASDIPLCEHYAIIESGSISIPGDQRSIDCPGHGYPASTENFVRYISYINQAEWEAEIKKRMSSGFDSDKKFVAMFVNPATIQTTHKVEFRQRGGASA